MKSYRIPLMVLFLAALAALVLPAPAPADSGVALEPTPAPEAPSPEPVAPVTCPVLPDVSAEGGPGSLTIEPIAMSCTSDCTDAYFACLDDCDAWPYPGCENDCRNWYNACRIGCLGG